jgi:hypothetical protein
VGTLIGFEDRRTEAVCYCRQRQNIFVFVLKPGNLHAAPCAAELLRGGRGIVIGDKGYCSEPLVTRLSFHGL